MSISTASFSSSACSLSSGMAQTFATPLKNKAVSVANGKAEVRQDSKVVQDAWASELSGRILLDADDVEEYLDIFVPCSTPYSTAQITPDPTATADYRPGPGLEVASYPGLISCFSKLVAPFDDQFKLSFVSTHKSNFPFPFKDFAMHHHSSSPDIAVSFPGETIDAQSVALLQWQKISLCVEAKAKSTQDPFPGGKNGVTHNATIVQAARNARNLMLTHGFLASFVLGVYGDIVRIARFDRSSAIVCKPFNLREEPGLLQRFFWHFTRPVVGNLVVGCDPSIRKLTTNERMWLKLQLQHSKKPSDRTLSEPEKCRRVEVYDDRDHSRTPFFVYKLIDVNGRLLSRSTMVWRAIQDKLQQDPNAEAPVKTCVLKEAWRQLIRKPEAVFYQRLEEAIPEDERRGLATFLCGGDLGQLEVREWAKFSDENAEILAGEQEIRLCSAPLSPVPADTPLETSVQPTSVPDPAISDPPLADLPTMPLPYPQQQTFSWSLVKGSSYACYERSQMRFVIASLGRPLTEFKNSKELVGAILDAIIGHRSAWEKAGILHRDVSLNNILIADDPEPGEPLGFLHDFDYSSMTDVAPGDSQSESRANDSTPTNDERKEKTGTHYFIAHQILLLHLIGVVHQYYHDLESFYWVLLWVVLRHTVHNLGQHHCESVFVYGNSEESAGHKKIWIDKEKTEPFGMLEFANNEPLTWLMQEFKELVRDQIMSRDRRHLTYDAIIAIFEKALKMDGWPDDDRVPCILLDSVRATQSQTAGAQQQTLPYCQIKKEVMSEAAARARKRIVPQATNVPPPIRSEPEPGNLEAVAGPSRFQEVIRDFVRPRPVEDNAEQSQSTNKRRKVAASEADAVPRDAPPPSKTLKKKSTRGTQSARGASGGKGKRRG